jgi:hypothetical protein
MGFSKLQWVLVPVLAIIFWVANLYAYLWLFVGGDGWLVNCLFFQQIILVQLSFPLPVGMFGDYGDLLNVCVWNIGLSIGSIYLFNVLRKQVRRKREVVEE